jgi:hypothetical protein
MTIFRLYSQNGHCADFWVQHRRWPNACARVASVNGCRYGELPEAVELRDDVNIALESFDVRSGRRLEAAPRPAQDASFVRIAEPAWYRPRWQTRAAPTRSRSC